MNKMLFFNPSRNNAILTFDTLDVMLFVPLVKDIVIEEKAKLISGIIEVEEIPFVIAQSMPSNANAFYDESSRRLWIIANTDHIFTLHVNVVEHVGKFNFNDQTFSGQLIIEKMPFERTDLSGEVVEGILKDVARADMKAEGIEDMEPKQKENTISTLMGAIEELAVQSDWLKKGMLLPLDDDNLYEIMKKHGNDIINYFEATLEINGKAALSQCYAFLGHLDDITDSKEIGKAKASLPKAFKRMVKLKEIQSGAVIGIVVNESTTAESGKVVLFGLKDMPAIAFGNVRVANYAFKAMKAHPEFGKYFIENSRVILIKELSESTRESKAILVKSAIEFVTWLSGPYEG